jgi:alpha-L-glutamate ligase-like protein
MTLLEQVRQLKDVGVLGMNRRNADVIMAYNPRRAFPLVDNKLLTKERAAAHGIPTPELYHVVSHHGAVRGFREAVRGFREFVVKPARGAGGSGIVIITGQRDGAFIKQNGETVAWPDLAYHLSGILSGIYSLEGLEDSALVEYMVRPDPVLNAVSYEGVPDIRIVVYRGIPVMAMTRLPTRASDGKANLHRGAVGAGIDIATGVTLGAVHRGRKILNHPDTGTPIAGVAIPYWERILTMAAKAFDMTELGYIGADVVLDRDRGPLLLELNARPGLQIQMANGAGLLKRLAAVDGSASRLPAMSVEERVGQARQLFRAVVAS